MQTHVDVAPFVGSFHPVKALGALQELGRIVKPLYPEHTDEGQANLDRAQNDCNQGVPAQLAKHKSTHFGGDFNNILIGLG